MARVRAPELLGRGGWIGASSDFGLSSLTGKVVILHFWTASCINCVRVLEELRPVEERFSAEAVVIGVHSPKFPREHEHEAVERAVERLGIRHPVLDDPDLATWQQYGVKGWPTLVVIDPEGYVVGGISGEGSGPVVFASVEQAIAEHEARGTLVRGAVAGVWGSMTMSPGLRMLLYPGKVTVDPTGRRLAIADTGNGRIVVTDLAGRVEHLYPLFTRPQGVRFDGERLIVCDTGADRVVSVDRASGSQTVLAEGLASPWDVAKLADGSLLVAEAGRHRLRLLPGDGGEPTVVAGTGQENLVDGEAPVEGEASDAGTDRGQPALLAQPSGLCALPGGGAVFVDAESSSLRVLTPDGRVVTLVGQGLFDWGASDGGPDSSALQHPLGVALGPLGGPTGEDGLPAVYVADALNGMIREWRGTAWSAGAGSLRTLPVSGLEEPGGIDVLPDGRLVVADTNHHQIVIVDPAAGQSETLTIDESWLGTAVGPVVSAGEGQPLAVPYSFDLGSHELDDSAGPAVQVEVYADPGNLLAAGPRRWALDDAAGQLHLRAGTAGEGIIVVTIEISVCDDEICTVVGSRSRHDLRITTPPAPPARQ